ncbi:biotin--[acetyl-CoA-carboxylase] ligase [Chelativorans sp. Marseille-P2723]|uniref:biotin--[acetyl-CoA-carboxylase] ligase n=1 Tax=Chelativorans sp. Marseille-P2723 TaxID=2709133 RepID=UPI00156E6D0A|nr:biotin--[acetyl-CoA-carboxylase] ligase [Chelativorans sp. Marseille-P2723]
MFALAPSALGAGYRLEQYESVGSTNALALERGGEGDPGKLWIVTARQTLGRGRRGRPWETPAGNLAATLLLVDTFEPTAAATLGFVAGLALSDALAALAPTAAGSGTGRGRFELKWPNDLLAGGAKLAGILLESTLLRDGRMALAIGIGVNVATHPEGMAYPVTSLGQMGVKADAGEVFLALSDAWIDNMRLWNGGRGLAAIRERWLMQAAGLGSQVSVLHEGRVVRGTFETIDDLCRFVIREDDGSRVRIAAGDVHFGTVASVRE